MKIGMIAGGTGITPFYQILQAAHLLADKCEFYLVFANRSTKDILLREELDNIFKKQNFKFSLFYTIDRHEDDWTGGVGHVNKDVLSTHLPQPDEDTLMLTCGPPVMCQDIVIPILKDLGHKADNIFDF
jgi:cytochrome-b5 reductase